MNKQLSAFSRLRIVKPGNRFLMQPDLESAGPADIVGIEIELENMKNFSSNGEAVDLLPYWKITEDGSLKDNGLEFISVPIFGLDIKQALATLNNVFLQTKSKPVKSIRAGLHIHLDVGDLSAAELVRLIEIYIVAEPLLYAYCGLDRENNIFCLPLYKTKSVLRQMASLCHVLELNTEDAIFEHVPNLFKYSGLNLRPIIPKTVMSLGDNGENKTGGHIEFRMHPAEHTTHEVYNWINMLLCLKTFARDKNNYLPVSMEDASRLDGRDYFHSLFRYLNPASLEMVLAKLQNHNIPTLMSNGLRTLSYFKVIKILDVFTKAMAKEDPILYKNTHPGLKKFREYLKEQNIRS